MTPLEDVQRVVLEACTALGGAEVRPADAVGCTLVADVVAGEAVPPWPNSAMDGIAVRAGDTPGRLRLVGYLPAGADPSGMFVGQGEAIRIMTGAPMPEGADAVVPVEDLRVADDDADDERGEIEALAGVQAGRHVRPAGGDAAVGDVVLPAGAEVTPAAVGVLSSLGIESCTVVRRARVGVLSTGDELVEGPGPLRPGQIRESNRPALLAAVKAGGFEPVDFGIARDDEAAIRQAIEAAAASCDAVLTTGGVSMGEADHVKGVLDQLSGGTFRWFQVAIRPAKPFAFGTVGGTPVFGLPGNPVSCLVSFELFARPGIRRRMGFGGQSLWRPMVAAEAPDGLPRSSDGKLHLVRVAAENRVGGRWVVREQGSQASNALTAMAVADALALVPDGDGVAPGGIVNCWLLR
ncbi:MAG: gephyrin-like molybdotransferase Glp [Acidimicrobiales bacterium]